MSDNIKQLPGARYCPNGHRWERCKAVMDVDESGMHPISCSCPYKQSHQPQPQQSSQVNSNK